MNEKVTKAIIGVIQTMMDRVMDRVLVLDPFVAEKHHANKPLYAALVPDEIFKGSHFERRFVTPFGRVWEKLAVQVALAYHGHCTQGASVQGTIGEESLEEFKRYLIDWNMVLMVRKKKNLIGIMNYPTFLLEVAIQFL